MITEISSGSVLGYLHEPDADPHIGMVLTHGAGGDCRSALLVSAAEAFCQEGFAVLRCDLPFRQKRPKGPPMRSAEADQQGLRDAASLLRARYGTPLVLAGHSYGGRQASLLAAGDASVAGALLLLSYPLHPPDKPHDMRTAHFPLLRVPSIFVQGTADGFASPDEIRAALELIPAKTELMLIEKAGHDLRRPQPDWKRIAGEIGRFLS